MDIVQRLRRMADMTTTGNDLADIGRAADEIERLRGELDRIVALYDSEDKRLDKVVGEKDAEIERLRTALDIARTNLTRVHEQSAPPKQEG